MGESTVSGHAGHAHAAGVSPDSVWLAATWPFVRGQLPPAPARVVELGCGPLGGHIPALIRAGYDATGVDPEAPEGPAYVRAAFEDYRPEGPADAVVAPSIDAGESAHVVAIGAVGDEMILDIGPATAHAYAQAIERAKTIVFN